MIRWMSIRWAPLICLLTACAGGDEAPPSEEVAGTSPGIQTLEDRILVVEGFAGPEAVRYDPRQDVYFVSNFNGGGGERDANGFISRVAAEDGTVEELRFMEGSDLAPLHAPRGMFITGDTLWVADIDGVHAFSSGSGEHLGFVDLSSFQPGFLNDVAAHPEGGVYVTDTGRSAVYRVTGGPAEVVVDTAMGGPNGITWDPDRAAFVLLPWEPGYSVHLWAPGRDAEPLGPATPGRLDGVEPLEGGLLLLASQTDSALHLLDAEGRRPLIRVGGSPADIAVDTRRGRVAVPYISLNRVDVWSLERRQEG